MKRRDFLLLGSALIAAEPALPVGRIACEGVTASVEEDALRIAVTETFDRYPSAILHAEGGRWDLALRERLEVEVRNDGRRKTTVMVFAFTPGGYGGISSFPQHENGRHTLAPGESTTIALQLHQKMPGAASTTILPANIAFLRYVIYGGQPGDILTFRHPVALGDVSPAGETPDRLTVPLIESGSPAAGRRVRQELAGFQGIPYVLYLPTDWKPGQRYPVICEYPGNIFFWKDCHSTGRTEQGNIGYGMSKGEGYIWVNLPFVAPGRSREQLDAWGDILATAEYARRAVRQVCEKWGGDPGAVILTGFSRGGMAASMIGLHDAPTADVWLAFHAVQGGDGSGWNNATRSSAALRVRRMAGRWTFLTESAAWEPILRRAGQHVTSADSGIGAHTDVMLLDPRPSLSGSGNGSPMWSAASLARTPSRAGFSAPMDGPSPARASKAASPTSR